MNSFSSVLMNILTRKISVPLIAFLDLILVTWTTHHRYQMGHIDQGALHSQHDEDPHQHHLQVGAHNQKESNLKSGGWGHQPGGGS